MKNEHLNRSFCVEVFGGELHITKAAWFDNEILKGKFEDQSKAIKELEEIISKMEESCLLKNKICLPIRDGMEDAQMVFYI